MSFSLYMPRPEDTDRPSGISPVQCQSKLCKETDDSIVSASVTLKTSPSAFILLTMLYHASEVRITSCGLYDSLCTLRVGRSTVCLSFPITQHSIRVAGYYTLPDRDLHPARSTKLRLARIEVGQPVTRLPPHIPRRAELPHRVPQSYSLMCLH